MWFRWEEEEHEDDGHIADCYEVDWRTEPAESELGGWELLATQTLGEHTADACDI